MQTDRIYEYAPCADEYALFDYLDQLLQECDVRGLDLTVVQGGADGADVTTLEEFFIFFRASAPMQGGRCQWWLGL